MRTARSLTLTLTAAASLLALAAPADAATGSWSATRGFTTGPANSGAVWSGAKGLGASLATDGVFRKTAEPKGWTRAGSAEALAHLADRRAAAALADAQADASVHVRRAARRAFDKTVPARG